jgi:hypothetical protein
MEKPGGLLCHQMPTPNLLGRHKTPGEQISGTQYSHRQPWDKSASPLDRLTPTQGKKEKSKLNNKQAAKKKDSSKEGGVP